MSFESPPDQNPEQTEADKKRASAIKDGMQAYVDANPGMSYRTAYHLVMKDKPHLFRDEAGRVPVEQENLKAQVAAKQDRIHSEISKMRAANPQLSFTAAWSWLRQSKPELFAFQPPKRSGRSEGVESAKRLVRVTAARLLKEQAEALRIEGSFGSFASAWAKLRKREPELFRLSR